MLDLPGYIIRDEIFEGFRTKVYRGWSVKRHAPVLIKVPKHATPSLSDIAGLVHEYGTTRDLEIEGIARAIELVDANSTLALVVEDKGAVPLAQYTGGRAVDLGDFLDMAARMAETLGRLHREGIVHRNISPETVLIHPETKEVTITGFAAEARDTDLKSVVESVNPAYMAPEQTGLTAYGVDHRADLYSLGIVFYQMLTGRLPLQAAGPSGWVWVHTAQEPTAPHTANPKIPPDLSAIVMKMLAKTPDDRYQSPFALIQDLSRCRYRIGATAQMRRPAFEPDDRQPRFSLSRKLYGRSKEAESLKAALEQVCKGGGGVVLVSGEAGMGKTMLVDEVLRIRAMEKGYYGYGKAGRIKQHSPYSIFVSAMEMVIKQMLSDSNARLAAWKADILRAVGRSGAVITELIPDIEVIIGPQPPVEVVQPREAQNRFFLTLGNFIGVFAKRRTPLVLFLDDLQWADLASLQLLTYLSRKAKYLLIVGAYRDSEVVEGSSLADFIEHVRERTSVTTIRLDPLREEDVVSFVADTLSCPAHRTRALADVLGRKTYGNPFFLGQALKTAYDENIVKLNECTGCWEWDIESVESLQVPEDVIDLILKRLARIPETTLGILKLASCLGHAFWLRSLSIVSEKPVSEISKLMLPAMREGLVSLAQEKGGDWKFEFVHDEIEKAVYSLFSEADRKRTHLRFGQLLLKEALRGDFDDMLLSTMDHVNRALDLVDDPGERLRFACYNLQAGRKAKAAVAHDSALSYFAAGRLLLPDDAWEKHYRLCYDLHFESAQCEYMVGGVDEAEKLLDLLLDHARTEHEKVDINSLKMLLFAGVGEYEKALRIGRDTLSALGMNMPERPGFLDNAREILLYKWLMLNRKVQHLAELPEMRHSRERKLTELLVKFILVTSTNYPDLYALTSLKAGNHALRHGSSEMAPIGYLGFGIAEGSVLGNYTRGYELGKAAISVVERYGESFTKCIVYFCFGALINHWTHNLKDGLLYLEKSIDYALRAGEVIVAGWAHTMILENKYLLGTPLSEILSEARRCSEYGEKVQHENLTINAWIYENAATMLTDRRAWHSSEDAWAVRAPVEGDKASLATLCFSEMHIRYLKGEYVEALSAMERLEEYLDAIVGFMISAECKYYRSLVITAAYPHLSAGERRRLMKRLAKDRRQMKKWSDLCPGNFRHKYLLVKAETARILGKDRKAEVLYDQAINAARNNGFVQDEAVACERAALFSMSKERTSTAKAYINDACRAYEKWGAAAKIQDLKTRYPELLNDVSAHKEKGQISAELLKQILADSDGRSRNAYGSPSAIQEAAKDLAGQVEPRTALRSFLETVMDITYANRGYLLLERDGELSIKFGRDSEQETAEFAEPVRVEQADQLSKAIVRFVYRTLTPVIIDEDHPGIFAKDRYIRKTRPKSVACAPILTQGVPIGVLYLENTLVAGIFTPERLEVVYLLANRLAPVKGPADVSVQTGVDQKLPTGEYLTEREAEILRLISRGLSNKEIGDRLGLTINTVKTHIKSLYSKLGVHGRVQALKRGQERGLL